MGYENIKAYLQETLGLSASIEPWRGGSAFPYYLQDAYELASIELLGANYVLMYAHKQSDTAAKIRKDIDAVNNACGVQGIYTADVLSSYDRKRLVGQRVPFIVPGNQLYLPDLGIDLREYFRQHREAPAKGLSPATQVMLISALLRPWEKEVHPAELVRELGYTSMTVSRAVKEMQSANLAAVVEVGRKRWVRFAENAKEVWIKARPLLRNPVKNTFWAFPLPEVQQQARLAGESALARATSLAQPHSPVLAISSEQWRLAQKLGMHSLPTAEPGAYLWQIWRYDPRPNSLDGVVDPLSLILSLRDEADERVQLALSEFEKGFP